MNKIYQQLSQQNPHILIKKIKCTQKYIKNISFAIQQMIEPGIIIDKFSCRKKGAIYFLTHWHADHYSGLTTTWDHGPIYCSHLTRSFLLIKYPKLGEVVTALSLNQKHELTSQLGFTVNVELFDANHMAGSIMILLQLPNTDYILHTGDMRFNQHLLSTSALFSYNPSEVQSPYSCTLPIHTVYLDNTYCDPIFQFPNRSEALQEACRIIDQHKGKRVFLATDSIGKEEAFVLLGRHYKTKVVVNKDRMKYVREIYGESTDRMFTLEEEGGWIEVIKKSQKAQKLKASPKSILITLTGWTNLPFYEQLSQNQFIVPYSLHSNYEELELFISAVRPKNIIPIVQHNNASTNFRKVIHSYQSYFTSLMYMKQRGLDFFIKNYTRS